MYAHYQHRDALPRHRAKMSSQSAPKMKPARERPGSPAYTAWSTKSLSSVRVGAPRRPRTRTTLAQRAERRKTCHYACRLETSWAAAPNLGERAAPPSKEASAGWIRKRHPPRSGVGRETNFPPGPGSEKRLGHPQDPGSGREPYGQERGPDRLAAPKLLPGPAQGHQEREPKGQKRSIPKRRRARVWQRGRRGWQRGWQEVEAGQMEAGQCMRRSEGGPRFGNLQRSAGRGQQGRKPPVCEVVAKRTLGVKEDLGQASSPRSSGDQRPGAAL
jgi:hypothetical protein